MACESTERVEARGDQAEQGSKEITLPLFLSSLLSSSYSIYWCCMASRFTKQQNMLYIYLCVCVLPVCKAGSRALLNSSLIYSIKLSVELSTTTTKTSFSARQLLFLNSWVLTLVGYVNSGYSTNHFLCYGNKILHTVFPVEASLTRGPLHGQYE